MGKKIITKFKLFNFPCQSVHLYSYTMTSVFVIVANKWNCDIFREQTKLSVNSDQGLYVTTVCHMPYKFSEHAIHQIIQYSECISHRGHASYEFLYGGVWRIEILHFHKFSSICCDIFVMLKNKWHFHGHINVQHQDHLTTRSFRNECFLGNQWTLLQIIAVRMGGGGQGWT